MNNMATRWMCVRITGSLSDVVWMLHGVYIAVPSRLYRNSCRNDKTAGLVPIHEFISWSNSLHFSETRSKIQDWNHTNLIDTYYCIALSSRQDETVPKNKKQSKDKEIDKS